MRLADLYPKLTAAERAELAAKAGLSTGYLWQIANRWAPPNGKRPAKRPTVELLQRLADADARLHLHDMVAEFARPTKQKAEAEATA